MATIKQTPKQIEPEKDIQEEIKNKVEPAVEDIPVENISVEVEKKSNWHKAGDLSDEIITVQICNIPDKTGMGKRNCMLRMINAATGELAGIPTILRGHNIVNGELQGE